MIHPARWFYCDGCDAPAIRCPACSATSCNGGGCGRCRHDFIEVRQLIDDGLAPRRDEVPVVDPGSDR